VPVPSVAVKAVIFDFSGTLFRCEEADAWLRATLAKAGIEATEEEIEHYAGRLHASGGQPGGHSDVSVPPHLEQLWQDRDLDHVTHRTVYTELTRLAGLPWPGIEEMLYDRHWEPLAWHPYPDTRAALESLRERGIQAGVLSNIVSDIRQVFVNYGLDALIAGYVLSYEHGIQKPDPEIFLRACEMLGQDPADVLMVGDNEAADGAATAVGCSFRAVSHLPVSQRPRALLDAVR
jgi:HAD superfamily hydrolase (TIGR01509 family)